MNGFSESFESSIGNASLSISANAAHIRARQAQADAADAHQYASHQSRRAAGANADFYAVVQMLAASKADNARLRAALDDSDDENASLSETIGRLRAQLNG